MPSRTLATFSLALLASLAAAGAPGLRPAAELLGAAAYGEALASGRASRVSVDGAPSLLPEHPAAEAFRAEMAAEKPSVLVELAFVLPRALPRDAAAAAAELASIYGLLGSFSSMEGIEYWSASRKTWRTFYAESYRIDDAGARRRLADPAPPAPGALPARESALVFQRDLSFGANVYEYRFRAQAGAVALESTNLTRMSYGPIPLVGPGGLRMRLLVLQAEDALVFYAASGADVPAVFRGKLQDSLGNRAQALFRWFATRARASFAE